LIETIRRRRVSISANGDKAAVWEPAPRIHVVNVPGGTPVVDVPVEAPYTPPTTAATR
jgi:hypothetical protein